MERLVIGPGRTDRPLYAIKICQNCRSVMPENDLRDGKACPFCGNVRKERPKWFAYWLKHPAARWYKPWTGGKGAWELLT